MDKEGFSLILVFFLAFTTNVSDINEPIVWLCTHFHDNVSLLPHKFGGRNLVKVLGGQHTGQSPLAIFLVIGSFLGYPFGGPLFGDTLYTHMRIAVVVGVVILGSLSTIAIRKVHFFLLDSCWSKYVVRIELVCRQLTELGQVVNHVGTVFVFVLQTILFVGVNLPLERPWSWIVLLFRCW